MSRHTPYGSIVLLDDGSYRVEGFAIVEARPVRSSRSARAIAHRIARAPSEYLSTITVFGVVGVRDIRGAYVPELPPGTYGLPPEDRSLFSFRLFGKRWTVKLRHGGLQTSGTSLTEVGTDEGVITLPDDLSREQLLKAFAGALGVCHPSGEGGGA